MLQLQRLLFSRRYNNDEGAIKINEKGAIKIHCLIFYLIYESHDRKSIYTIYYTGKLILLMYKNLSGIILSSFKIIGSMESAIYSAIYITPYFDNDLNSGLHDRISKKLMSCYHADCCLVPCDKIPNPHKISNPQVRQ